MTRSFPLSYNDKEPSQPFIIEKDEEQYSDPNGSIFVVTGTGGADQHNFTGQAPFMEKQFKRFGFLDVQVIDNGTRMICTFYENRDGTDKDKFTITKSKLSSITEPLV